MGDEFNANNGMEYFYFDGNRFLIDKGILKDVSADGDIDDDIMKKFLPALGAMAHQRMIDNPDFRRRRWRLIQRDVQKSV